MPRRYVFADEAGNLDFKHGQGASRYFILTTVTMADCSVGDALTTLRRELAWERVDHPGHFHATEDPQAIRDRVFEVLASHDFRIDATIFDKPKTQPHLQTIEAFYKLAWFLHFKHVAPRITTRKDELLVVAAAFGTRKQRSLFSKVVQDVVNQVTPVIWPRTAFWGADCEPCLQAADYCCWALQRKWERGDERSYQLIRDKVRSEYAVFSRSTRTYY